MPKFAANLSFMYNEVPFLERFAAAARDGFKAVEFMFPYEHSAAVVAMQLRANGLQNVLFNMPPGNWAAGERGLGALPGREAEFHAGIARALEYAVALNCPRIHVMSGIVPDRGDRASMHRTLVENLRIACAAAAKHHVNLLLEPINTRDIPGYFLNRQDEANALVIEVGAANLKVQMDLYHCQIVEGDVAMKIRKYIANVDHVQIAGVPERHEPDIGEVNYPYLFRLLDEIGYRGWIGCEYRPRGGSSAGLGWLRPWT
jgi:2-dehydrotetronate isomerase